MQTEASAYDDSHKLICDTFVKQMELKLPALLLSGLILLWSGALKPNNMVEICSSLFPV